MKSKKTLRKSFFAIVGAIVALVCVLLLFLPGENTGTAIGINITRSVGIIGGADGPTSIFVASKVTDNVVVYVIIILFVIIGYIVYKKLNKNKK